MVDVAVDVAVDVPVDVAVDVAVGTVVTAGARGAGVEPAQPPRTSNAAHETTTREREFIIDTAPTIMSRHQCMFR